MALTQFDLTGRVAVVIGGTSGLGLAMARGLAQAGADVVPVGRRGVLVDPVCAMIESLGRRTLRHPADATSRASLEALRDAVLGRLGRVDILLNAAGRTLKKPTVDVTEAEWSGITAAISTLR